MGWGLAALAAPEAMSNPKDLPANKHYQTLPQTQNSQLKLVEILYNFEYVEICRNSEITCWAQQLIIPKGPMKSPNELLGLDQF